MKRKLIKQGLGGYTLSLPVDWIRTRNLNYGDEIDVYEEKDKLIIGGIGKNFKKKEIVIDNLNKSVIRTLLASYYRLGYHEIILKFKESQPYSLLQEIVQTLIGYEIISQTKDTCIIRDIMKEEDETSFSLINKLFQSINLLYDYAIENTEKRDMIEINALRQNIQRLRDYTLRKIRIEDNAESFELYSFVVTLEKISGDYFYIAKTNKKLTEKIKNIFFELQQKLKEMHKIFLNKNFNLANTLHSHLLKEIHQDLDKNIFLDKINIDKELLFYANRILHNLFNISSRLQLITSLNEDNV